MRKGFLQQPDRASRKRRIESHRRFPMTHPDARRPITVPTLVAAASIAAGARAQQDCVFPPQPGPVVVLQPDGTEVPLRLRRGERARWYEDASGYPVVRTSEGYVYATLDPSGELVPTEWPAGRGDPRALGIPARVRPGAPRGAARKDASLAGATPHGGGGAFALGTGSVKNLVLLLRFSDHGPSGQNRTLPSNANVATIMNAVGGDPVFAPTGSVRDHFLETSYGQFTIDSTVVGWIDVPNTEIFYANGSSGLTQLTWDLIVAGLNAADASVNFSQYDEDGDGWVDAITFLHSGYGAEWGGFDQYGRDYVDRMWSHKWSIPTWTSAEGVKVSDYNISPGLWDVSGSAPGRIGVVCHELGHFFGIPDLYDTDGSSQGIGNWCLMAAGSWGFDGEQRHPSHPSAWTKSKLGWLSPTILLPGVHSAPQVEFNASVFRIDSGYPPGEYLLVENRQKVGMDLQIPQGGLAIWHVDESSGSLTENTPNNAEGYPGQGGWPGNGNHFRNAMLQADGGFDMEHDFDRGDSGDVYRSGGVTALNSGTTPNTNAYQGGTILTNGNAISGIGASSANMAFTYSSPSSPSITTSSAPAGTLGTPYSLALASTGGTAPRTWSEFRASPSYALTDLGTAPFTLGGTALNLNSDEATTTIVLPFEFPYWERGYTSVTISTNGFLELNPSDPEYGNTTGYLRANVRIAPMWDDLRTDLAGGNVFVDTGTPGQARIRWNAATFAGSNPCNFAVRLYADGRIDFEYGTGNNGLTASVGISRGHSGGLVIAPTHDGESSLANAHKLRFTLQGSQIPPGLTLSSAGVLGGTPTTSGSYQPIFRVTDAGFRYDQRLLGIAIGTGCGFTASPLSNASACEGLTSAFCTTAGGPGPFTYAWTKNGNAIPGATQSCYTATAGSGGVVDTYCVTVTGGCGSPIVRCATLTASTNVSATALSNAARCPGQTTTFCTTAGGTGPYTYAWTKNGNTIAGATASCHVATAGAGGTVDTYCVTVTGACGSAVQRCATLTAQVPTAVTPLPAAAACAGQTFTFCTTASGTGPFTYVWDQNGVVIPGATSSCHVATAGAAGTFDDYCVTVTGACGPPAQQCATLTATGSTAATPLTSGTVAPGVPFLFCTTASGTGPITFAWTKNGVPIPGATSSCTIATAGTGGSVDTYCVTVHGACGADVVRCATLTAQTATSYCFGDASSPTACPCANFGAAGHGCENSSATGGAVLVASGTTVPDTAVLTATGEKPTALTIFLQGTSTIAPVVYGDGLRCVGGNLKRLYAKNAVGGQVAAPTVSDLSITARSAQLNDPIQPGQMRFYMTYYRDAVSTFCPIPTGNTFNGSNAVAIGW